MSCDEALTPPAERSAVLVSSHPKERLTDRSVDRKIACDEERGGRGDCKGGGRLIGGLHDVCEQDLYTRGAVMINI